MCVRTSWTEMLRNPASNLTQGKGPGNEVNFKHQESCLYRVERAMGIVFCGCMPPSPPTSYPLPLVPSLSSLPRSPPRLFFHPPLLTGNVNSTSPVLQTYMSTSCWELVIALSRKRMGTIYL